MVREAREVHLVCWLTRRSATAYLGNDALDAPDALSYEIDEDGHVEATVSPNETTGDVPPGSWA